MTNAEIIMYKNFDTGELWTREEIEAEYNRSPELAEVHGTFDDYLDFLLDLGKQKVGGVVEEVCR